MFRPFFTDLPPRLRRLVGLLVSLMLVCLILHCGPASPLIVIGNSMAPALLPYDCLLLDRLAPRLTSLRRGDLVSLRVQGVQLIKRIHALPGDVVYELWSRRDDTVIVLPAEVGARLHARQTINARDPFTVVRVDVYPGQLYVLGDLTSSFDSRELGPVKLEQVVGLGRPLTLASLRAVGGEVLGLLRAAAAPWSQRLTDWPARRFARDSSSRVVGNGV